MNEIIVDNFAGGGGASTGIELAIGRSVNIAINHDPAAIAMHKANHPTTEHYIESVWDVDPVKAVRGRPVALCWFSPDCKHFSKAKGGKPVEKNIRGLAWVAVKWAAKVKPRVIMLENVEEFKTWGPIKNGYPDISKKGQTFNHFVKALENLGYVVEYRELKACDFGAPTIRKRFFLVARRDGNPIVWPKPTHGNPNGLEVSAGLIKPWRTASEIIDWDIPCRSIFERKKPLAENTLKRIAKGIQKFVINDPNPFIVQVNHSGANHHYCNKIETPLPTVTAKHGFGLIMPYLTKFQQNSNGQHLQKPIDTVMAGATRFGLITPTIISYHSETSEDETRALKVDSPIHTLDTSNRFGLVASFLTKYYGGGYKGAGADLKEPVPTVTAIDHNAVVSSHIIQMNNNCIGQNVKKPLNTIVAGAGHLGEVRAFLIKYYSGSEGHYQSATEPLHTITTKDRFGLITIEGQDYQIVDIGMRMLEPHELFAAQGFPKDYIIDKDDKGKPYPKTAQVARCGNAVPPPFAEHLVRANLPELCSDKIYTLMADIG